MSQIVNKTHGSLLLNDETSIPIKTHVKIKSLDWLTRIFSVGNFKRISRSYSYILNYLEIEHESNNVWYFVYMLPRHLYFSYRETNKHTHSYIHFESPWNINVIRFYGATVNIRKYHSYIDYTILSPFSFLFVR